MTSTVRHHTFHSHPSSTHLRMNFPQSPLLIQSQWENRLRGAASTGCIQGIAFQHSTGLTDHPPFHQSSCSRKPFVPKLHCQQKNQTHLNKTCAADLMPATSAVSCPPSPAAIPAPGALPRHLWGVLALKMRSHGLDRERWWETALEASPSQTSPEPCMPADQRCCPQPAHHHTP